MIFGKKNKINKKERFQDRFNDLKVNNIGGKEEYERIKKELSEKHNKPNNSKKFDRISNFIRTVFIISAIGSAVIFGDKFNIYDNFKKTYENTKNKIEGVLTDNIQKRSTGLLTMLENENNKQPIKTTKIINNSLASFIDSLFSYLSIENKKKIISNELNENYKNYEFIIKNSLIENIKDPSESYFIINKMLPLLDKEGIESIIYNSIGQRFGKKSPFVIDEINYFYYKFEYKKPIKN